jgi:uncharacterized protein
MSRWQAGVALPLCSRKFTRMNRRGFLRNSVALGSLAALGPLQELGRQVARGQAPVVNHRYGPLQNRGDLWLPEGFQYQIISRQGKIMSDGRPTPGIFDAMGAFPAPRIPGAPPRTVLIRNHENREIGGEQRVVTTAGHEYDAMAAGGNTKLVVERRTLPRDPATGEARYDYVVVQDFAILGGTSTNCAGGELPFKKWVTCEEVVKRTSAGRKHGYAFEIDAMSEVPVPAVPILGAGRFIHEAAAWRCGMLFLTEDRSIASDPLLGEIGACLYRYVPNQRVRRHTNLAFTQGRLQALRVKGEFHANMHLGRSVGTVYPVEWVDVDEPDHNDDTDERRDRVRGFIPTRIQAQDKGAAYFDRLEGMWATGSMRTARVYFAATSGGAARLGQVWELDPMRNVLRLLYESTAPETLRNPDNIAVVPQTRDVLLCEDGGGPQFIRGLTGRGEIYDFVRTGTNNTEFCGACFDRGGHTLFVNQQGDRGSLPNGVPGAEARTYAIWGPWRRFVR